VAPVLQEPGLQLAMFALLEPKVDFFVCLLFTDNFRQQIQRHGNEARGQWIPFFLRAALPVSHPNLGLFSSEAHVRFI
jgi:hypothetical protein